MTPKRQKSETTLQRAERALCERFNELHPGKECRGKVSHPEENLFPILDMLEIEKAYKQGAGKEWSGKIKSIRSSSALVANTFGPWLKKPDNLTINGLSGFNGSIELEYKCPSGLGGTPPHLDALLRSNQAIVGIESKLLEPLEKGHLSFPASYSKNNLPLCEDSWWHQVEEWRSWLPVYFDFPQIIKH